MTILFGLVADVKIRAVCAQPANDNDPLVPRPYEKLIKVEDGADPITEIPVVRFVLAKKGKGFRRRSDRTRGWLLSVRRRPPV